MKRLVCASVVLSLGLWCSAAEQSPKPIVEFTPTFDLAALKLTDASAKLITADPGATSLEVKLDAGAYPGVTFEAPAGEWDLSAALGVEAEVANTGAQPLRITLRVDNAGDWKTNPWNAEHLSVDPAQTKTIRVTFGRSYNQPGFALDPAHVKRILVFAVTPQSETTLQVKSIRPFGSSGKIATAETKAPAAAPAVAPAPVATPTPAVAPAPALAPATDALPLLDLTKSPDENRMEPTSDQVTLKAATPGVDVAIAPGDEGWPGVRIKPADDKWDLSRFGHIEAQLTNTSAKLIRVSLRVDNAGRWQDGPWNTEVAKIEPGKSATLKVIFGYSWGRQPGYALKSDSVVGILFFTDKSAEPQSFRIESLRAAGATGEKP